MNAYQVLSLTQGIALTDEAVKRAYRRHAKAQHPDRGGQDFVTLNDAYTLIATADDRRKYDAALAYDAVSSSRRHLAQAVDLSLFDYEETADGSGTWSYPCRCGATYVLAEEQLVAGIEWLDCSSCSLAVRPMYHRVPDQPGGDDPPLSTV